jgi:hypothetical protein
MDIKQLLKDIKAKFNGEVTPPTAPVVPAAPAALATPTIKAYKLQDGVTEILISQASDVPAIGDAVTIGGAPAPANTYTLQDGATIVVDATGAITSYTAMAAPPPPPPAPPAPPQPVTLSAEEFEAMVAKFAVGSTEERLTNAEIMLKALMECNFGYEIRKGKEAAAIEVYKETLAPLQISVEAATQKIESQFSQIESQKETIAKHEQTIKDLFDLVEKLVELPTADPVTLTGNKKEKFEKENAKQLRLERIAEAVKKQKALA